MVSKFLKKQIGEERGNSRTLYFLMYPCFAESILTESKKQSHYLRKTTRGDGDEYTVKNCPEEMVSFFGVYSCMLRSDKFNS